MKSIPSHIVSEMLRRYSEMIAVQAKRFNDPVICETLLSEQQSAAFLAGYFYTSGHDLRHPDHVIERIAVYGDLDADDLYPELDCFPELIENPFRVGKTL